MALLCLKLIFFSQNFSNFYSILSLFISHPFNLVQIPSDVWMCPNHVESLLDARLTSSRVTERVNLWDKERLYLACVQPRS